MYQTVHSDQAALLHEINALYLGGEGIDLDPMYGKGGFYKKFPKPTICSDINPVAGEYIQDATNLCAQDGTMRSMILDPPFMHAQGKASAMKRYATYPSQRALQDLYHRLLWEAARVLVDKGVLIFKCQDTVESGKQVMTHCKVYEMATRIGFDVLDLFILTARSRVVGHNHGRQVHARKFHAYVWCFRKNAKKYANAGMWAPHERTV